MKIKTKEWLAGKHVTAIKHKGLHDDFESAQKAISKQSFRLNWFKIIATPVFVTTLFTAAGLSATQAFASPTTDFSDQAGQVHSEIRDDITPGYEQLQKLGGTKHLTIIDKNDPNRVSIIENADSRIIPDYTDSLERDPLSESGLDLRTYELLKKQRFVDLVNKKLSKPSVHATNYQSEYGTVCFVQYDVNGFVVPIGNYENMYFSLSNSEIRLGTAIHEIAHCQDIFFNGYPETTLKAEVTADVTAALLIASHTGNWDYADHSIGALRFLNYDDPEHSTHFFLEELKNNVNLQDLAPLDQREAFEMAVAEISKMNFGELKSKTDHLVSRGIAYYNLIKNDSGWDDLPDFFLEKMNDQGIQDKASFEASMEDHGRLMTEVYLNHINYISFESEDPIIDSMLDRMEKHAEIFNDEHMSNAIQHQRDLISERGVMDMESMASDLGFQIDIESKYRHRMNNQGVEHILDQYQPQIQSLSGITFNDNFNNGFSVNSNAKNHFLDRAGLDDGRSQSCDLS